MGDYFRKEAYKLASRFFAGFFAFLLSVFIAGQLYTLYLAKTSPLFLWLPTVLLAVTVAYMVLE